jgi:hypothetical protein
MLTKQYFDFHTKYLSSITTFFCQKATDEKDGSCNWPMTDFMDADNRSTPIIVFFFLRNKEN